MILTLSGAESVWTRNPEPPPACDCCPLQSEANLEDVQKAKVLSFLLFVFIYSIPFLYFPYKILARILVDRQAQLDDIRLGIGNLFGESTMSCLGLGETSYSCVKCGLETDPCVLTCV